MTTNIFEEATAISAEILNPFIHKLELTTYDKIKVVVMTVTVLPIRLLLMLILLSSAWFLAVVGLFGISKEDMKSKPMSGWRRYYLKPFICSVLRLMFLLGGWHWITIKGKQASAKEAPIITLAPHSSVFDVLPVILLGGPSVVAKAETEQTPFFGKLINYTQPVYVRRNDPMSRQNTIKEIRKRAESDDDWEQIVIFPEGTCTNRQCLISFKPGAFYPGVPVQPVCIRYPNKLDTMTWTWEGPGALKLLWLTLCQFRSYCEIEYLPVYKPNEIEKRNPRLFAQNVKLCMAQALGVPVSYYTFDDLKFIKWNGDNKIPQTPALVKLVKYRHQHGLKFTDIGIEVKKLQLKLKDENRICTLQEFSHFLESSSSDTLRDIFDVMDQANEGKIDVRIYIACLLMLDFNTSILERADQAFKMFCSRDDLIDLQSFCSFAWLMLGLTKTAATSVFHKLDPEHKGTVSFKEFELYLSESYLQHKVSTNAEKEENESNKCTNNTVLNKAKVD
ncbi:lysophosphatidylcholine acyltransferase isoform X2 [Centruroides vittatus]|uniref:lysophosphatidylcholine acyltransferase isoform X2 n=1 Tax=Centruroides vittatus TaxID=120091 RepID=UPI003510198C